MTRGPATGPTIASPGRGRRASRMAACPPDQTRWPGATARQGSGSPGSAHSAWSQLTPGTGAVVHLLRYEGADPLSGDATLARLEALMDQVQPGWRERVVHRRFLPRMVVVHHLPAPGEGLALRPGVRDSAIPGVFLAGDWVGAEGWLAGASLRSGLAAAGAVLAAHSAPQPARTASPVAR